MATLVQAPEDVVASLERKVLDTSTSLPEKYRVLFSLRNVAGTAATKALITGEGAACSDLWRLKRVYASYRRAGCTGTVCGSGTPAASYLSPALVRAGERSLAAGVPASAASCNSSACCFARS